MFIEIYVVNFWKWKTVNPFFAMFLCIGNMLISNVWLARVGIPHTIWRIRMTKKLLNMTNNLFLEQLSKIHNK